MKKYLYSLGLILSVSQANAFRVEYRTPPNGSSSGNLWAIDFYAKDSNNKELYGTAKRALLNSCVDHGSSCTDYKSPLTYTVYMRQTAFGCGRTEATAANPSDPSGDYIAIAKMDTFTAPCNALITYVYDSNTQFMYRTVEKVIQKAWKINGANLTEDSTNNGKSLMDIYPNSDDYWNQKPVDTCPNYPTPYRTGFCTASR